MGNKTGTKAAAAALVLAMALSLAACGHEHTWTEAACTVPKTCSACGKTEGEPLGHTWKEATCTSPQICSVCDSRQGEPLGHTWQEATCTVPKTCTVCGETEGEAAGHSFSWTTAEQSTCSEAGKEEGLCSVCGETEHREMEKLPHTPDGEWVVTKEAVGFAEGTRVHYCSVCGEVAEEESYKLSPEEQEAYFKSTCENFTYDEIARNPDDYFLKSAKFQGKVVQVIEDGDKIKMRLNITKGRYTWSDTIYVEYTRKDSSESRILEDDIINVYGSMWGTITYETIFGASVTIPAMLCSYVEF